MVSGQDDWFAGQPYDQQSFAGRRPDVDPSFSAVQRLAREADALCAEVEGLESEVVAEHDLNRKAMAEIKRLREGLAAALKQNERFAAELTKLRALIDTHNDQCRECPVLEA